MPLVVRGAVKPISTLARPLPSADLVTGEHVEKAHYERSDICVVPAAGVSWVNSTAPQSGHRKPEADTALERAIAAAVAAGPSRPLPATWPEAVPWRAVPWDTLHTALAAELLRQTDAWAMVDAIICVECGGNPYDNMKMVQGLAIAGLHMKETAHAA